MNRCGFQSMIIYLQKHFFPVLTPGSSNGQDCFLPQQIMMTHLQYNYLINYCATFLLLTRYFLQQLLYHVRTTLVPNENLEVRLSTTSTLANAAHHACNFVSHDQVSQHGYRTTLVECARFSLTGCLASCWTRNTGWSWPVIAESPRPGSDWPRTG